MKRRGKIVHRMRKAASRRMELEESVDMAGSEFLALAHADCTNAHPTSSG